MSLIDETYFIHEIDLPVNNYTDIQGFIDIFEPEVLERALGYRLAKDVLAYNETTPSPIKELVEGGEFTDMNGNILKWNGIINSNKKSFVAYYTYYYYRRSKVTYTTQIGEVKAKSENSIDAEIGNKIMRAWMLMLRELNIMQMYINTIDELKSIYKPETFGFVNSFDI